MIGMTAKTQDMMERVAKAADRAAAGNVRAMAYLVMVTSKASIKKAPPPTVTVTAAPLKRNAKGQFKKGSGKRGRKVRRRIPSPRGTPPHTHTGLLPRAIGYAVEGSTAVIGTQYSMIGTGGEPHEEAGEYKGDVFPDRAFMGPALDKTSPLFGPKFQGSIGG